jgi:hypothetical protein
MEHIERLVLTDAALAAKTAALGAALKYIAQRTLAILAFMAFTYGLLAAEVELAKLEGFPAAVIR